MIFAPGYKKKQYQKPQKRNDVFFLRTVVRPSWTARTWSPFVLDTIKKFPLWGHRDWATAVWVMIMVKRAKRSLENIALVVNFSDEWWMIWAVAPRTFIYASVILDVFYDVIPVGGYDRVSDYPNGRSKDSRYELGKFSKHQDSPRLKFSDQFRCSVNLVRHKPSFLTIIIGCYAVFNYHAHLQFK